MANEKLVFKLQRCADPHATLSKKGEFFNKKIIMNKKLWLPIHSIRPIIPPSDFFLFSSYKTALERSQNVIEIYGTKKLKLMTSDKFQKFSKMKNLLEHLCRNIRSLKTITFNIM